MTKNPNKPNQEVQENPQLNSPKSGKENTCIDMQEGLYKNWTQYKALNVLDGTT